jgi:hypothetical protein
MASLNRASAGSYSIRVRAAPIRPASASAGGDAWPVLDGAGEQLARLAEIGPGTEQTIELRAVLGPLSTL